jgi:S1-C subfamily serine protease
MPPRVARRVPGVEQRVVQVAGAEVERTAADWLVFAPEVDLDPAPKLGVILAPTGQAEGAEGLIVQGFSPNGKAEAAGLRKGDRVIAVEGRPVAEVGDIRASLLDKKVGDTVRVRVRRGEREQTLTVELATLPEGGTLPPGHP